MERVIANLLENAIFHTPDEGSIDLSVTSSVSEVSFKITDTGKGITEEDLPRIFDRFYRADKNALK